MSVSILNLASLDFNTIANDLKTFYKNKPEWSDYDFESEGLATTLLMDIHSAITYKLNVYANAELNETFLSTAKTRDAVVRKAKMLNYRIQSCNAADATLRLTFRPSTYPAQIIIPKYTRFNALDINGNSFNFLTMQTYYCYPNENYEYICDINVIQGIQYEYSWIVANNQKIFTIPNNGVDTRRMTVQVKQSESDLNWVTYNESSNIIDNNENSTVYFVQEGANQLFEFYFGDDNVGKAIKDGNIIKLSYIVTEGVNGNNLTEFNLLDTLDYDCEVTTVVPSANGKDIESISSIKRYAPMVRNAQGRAVNAEDFEAIIKERISQIDSISTWGGEENTPPLYGKVCISAITSSNYVLSDTLKEQVNNLFNGNNIIGSKQLYWVEPIMVDLIPNLHIYYDTNTSLSQSDLELIIRYGINVYNNSSRTFNYEFDISSFIEFLKGLNTAFLDIIVDNKLQYNTLNYKTMTSLNVDFQNSLVENSLNSNKYFNDDNLIAFLRDDGKGYINEYVNNNGVDVISKSKIGTINYTTGAVVIDTISISEMMGDDYFRINVTPSNNKIAVKHNVLLNIPFDSAVINLIG
ncbi:hypothetical protein J6W34_09575 [bacterium]|nr:hypothetical protein [bacterium]